MKRLLINWVYHRPVGHVIEALRFARDFAAADPELEVSLLLNREAPAELAGCVPSVRKVYEIDLERAGTPTGFPKDLPREWDYVFTDPRAGDPETRALGAFHRAFGAWVQTPRTNDGWNAATFPPRRIEPLRLELPDAARASARELLNPGATHRITLLPGSSSHTRTPSIEFWTELCQAFFDRYAGGEIVLLGAFDGERSVTRGISRREVSTLIDRFPAVRNAFDRGLLTQLAVAESSQMHISPHTGMSFAVQAVGVPWLAIAGQEWWEYLLNGVPLLSIYPECPLYPCFAKMYPECESATSRKVRTPCIDDAALFAKLPEIVRAMEALIERRVSYAETARRHEDFLRSRVGAGPKAIVDWPEVIDPAYLF